MESLTLRNQVFLAKANIFLNISLRLHINFSAKVCLLENFHEPQIKPLFCY